MIRVSFTENLQRHVSCDTQMVSGQTVRLALDAVFVGCEQVRGYVLDEHGALRKHMNVFVNGNPIADRETLSDQLRDNDEVFVMQALSGG